MENDVKALQFSTLSRARKEVKSSFILHSQNVIIYVLFLFLKKCKNLYKESLKPPLLWVVNPTGLATLFQNFCRVWYVVHRYFVNFCPSIFFHIQLPCEVTLDTGNETLTVDAVNKIANFQITSS